MNLSKPHFSTVALVGRYQTPGIARTLAQITAWLNNHNVRVLVESECAGHLAALEDSAIQFEAVELDEIGKQADLAIAVGGDGTMLGLARSLAGSNIALLGINHGRLGFITDIPLDQWPAVLAEILMGHFREETRSLLVAQVMRNGQSVFSAPALNDVVISRSNTGRMVEIDVEVDGTYMVSQRCDGLIISTPTGSTAYALSANGPILHPNLLGMVLVPVAPQSLSNRPIVLPETSLISIRVSDAEDARVHCDMQVFAALEENDSIEVFQMPKGVRFIHPPGHSFFATLRQKLNWHAAPSFNSSDSAKRD
jgi:NAD+ kinase